MKFNYYIWMWQQVITHIRECHRDSNQYTWSLGPYVRLPFAKLLRGQNRSSTLGIKFWFHSNRPTLSSSWATSFSLQQPP
jgi:hypothetical protein